MYTTIPFTTATTTFFVHLFVQTWAWSNSCKFDCLLEDSALSADSDSLFRAYTVVLGSESLPTLSLVLDCLPAQTGQHCPWLFTSAYVCRVAPCSYFLAFLSNGEHAVAASNPIGPQAAPTFHPQPRAFTLCSQAAPSRRLGFCLASFHRVRLSS
jgi:hypothetical protein